MARSHEITLYGAIHGVSIKVRVDMLHLLLFFIFVLLRALPVPHSTYFD